jgi:hypothetical protein
MARTGNEMDPAAEKKSRQARARRNDECEEKGHPPMLKDGLYLREWPVDWTVGEKSPYPSTEVKE